MTATAYFQPKFEQNHIGKKLVNLSSDTLVVGLIASGTLAARGTSEGYEFVSDLLANGGSALTEVSTGGTGYARQNLVSVSYTVSGSWSLSPRPTRPMRAPRLTRFTGGFTTRRPALPPMRRARS